MDIKAQALYSELQSMASQARIGMPEVPSIQTNPTSTNFSEMLTNAINGVNSMQINSREQTQRFEMGDPGLSLADVMVAKEKSGIAFEATVQVRNKVLEAYKQIMNMPV